MATVTSYTKDRLDELMDENIVDGAIVGDDLILEKRDGSTVNAGDVRGPAGTDAAPGSVTVVADTTIIRTSDGRGKVATPTAAEDATTKAYVDAINTSLDGRLDTLEGQTLDARLDTLEGQTLDARLDAIETVTTSVRRVGSNVRTSNTTAGQSETNICSFTIPNPINGRTYRCIFSGSVAAASSTEGRVRIKHGISAVTGGTQIQEACTDHQSARAQSVHMTVEFTFTGTTGQASYNVVVTHIPIAAVNLSCSASSTRPAVLIVDEIV